MGLLPISPFAADFGERAEALCRIDRMIYDRQTRIVIATADDASAIAIDDIRVARVAPVIPKRTLGKILQERTDEAAVIDVAKARWATAITLDDA
jgi:hypothetical protein